MTLAKTDDAKLLARIWAERLTDAMRLLIFGEPPEFSRDSPFGSALDTLYVNAAAEAGALTTNALNEAFEELPVNLQKGSHRRPAGAPCDRPPAGSSFGRRELAARLGAPSEPGHDRSARQLQLRHVQQSAEPIDQSHPDRHRHKQRRQAPRERARPQGRFDEACANPAARSHDNRGRADLDSSAQQPLPLHSADLRSHEHETARPNSASPPVKSTVPVPSAPSPEHRCTRSSGCSSGRWRTPRPSSGSARCPARKRRARAPWWTRSRPSPSNRKPMPRLFAQCRTRRTGRAHRRPRSRAGSALAGRP